MPSDGIVENCECMSCTEAREEIARNTVDVEFIDRNDGGIEATYINEEHDVTYTLKASFASNNMSVALIIDGEELRHTFTLNNMSLAARAEPFGSSATLNSYMQRCINNNYFGMWEDTEVYGASMSTSFVAQAAAYFMEHWEEINPLCDTCGGRHEDDVEHIFCEGCEESFIEDDTVYLAIEHNDGNRSTEGSYCSDCHSNMPSCYECGDTVCEDCAPEGDGNPHCLHCFERAFAYCEECEDYQYADSFDGSYCSSCTRERRRGPGEIRGWSYRPNFIFHPPLPEDAKKPLYIGMEIEVSMQDNIHSDAYEVAEWRNRAPEGVIYFKSDSSVSNGWEMVTHPMQPQWALDNLPWKWLNDLQDYAKPTHDTCGTHIHVNKEAFTSTHLWKFMQIHFRLADFCGLVGGRGTQASYGALKSTSRSGPDAQRQDLMKIVKEKGAISKFDRSVGLNLQNEYTIEMRYMRGGTEVPEIKKNIEWVMALYEFSDQIAVRYVRDGVIDDPGYLLQWIKDRRERFPNLLSWIETRLPSPKEMPTYKESL